ncbi:MAG: cysteine desulfurase NifS [Bacillota bacterium]
MKKVYLDHSATTKVRKEVVDLMTEYMLDKYGNPSSIHSFGREAKKAMEQARERIAKILGCETKEIYFTSGGTEADNLAIIGCAFAYNKKGNHIITSAIEHHAVMDACKYLEKRGFNVTYLPVDENGIVGIENFKQAIKPETILATIMHVNNEVGTIQDIAKMGAIAKEKGVIFHTDAVQSFGKIPVNVQDLNVDMLSASSHKIYGPKGAGFLYVKKGIKMQSIVYGGAQERKIRPGTENLPGIVGFGLAAELAVQEMANEANKLTHLRDTLIKGILEKIPHTRLNGHPVKRIPSNVNVSIEFIEGESLLLSLDMRGIAASSGSACTSGSLDPSHVLLAMGLSHEAAHGSLRMTLGMENTEEDIQYVLEVLPEIVDRLRAMSPLYNKSK